jgi:hypothetical protein
MRRRNKPRPYDRAFVELCFDFRRIPLAFFQVLVDDFEINVVQPSRYDRFLFVRSTLNRLFALFRWFRSKKDDVPVPLMRPFDIKVLMFRRLSKRDLS